MELQTSSMALALPDFLSGGGEMGQRIRDFDWSETTLGPVHTWPQSLRTCIRIMLSSRQPIWIGWGKELIKLYNDPYIAIVGGKHPWALGAPVSVVWKDIWRDIDPLLQQVMKNDEGVYVESQLLIMERNGYPEETYYTFSYTPIPGDGGGTGGIICANTDDTDRNISERQLKTLTQLGKNLTNCHANKEVISRTIESLNDNRSDFPFVLFYSIEGNKAILSHTSDLGKSNTILPSTIALGDDSKLSACLQQALTEKKLQLFEGVGSDIGAMPTGEWEISSDKAIILPIVQASTKEAFGLMIVGLNPYRLLNEKYCGFFNLVADLVATSFADAHVQEEERKRSEALAEIDRAKTTFFSNISHEFRTPLTLLLAPIEDVLSAADISPEHKVRMDVAYRNALRMQKLVNTLLEFSRIEAGRVEGKFSLVDIGVFTEDLASTFRSAIEKAGMQLAIHRQKIRDEVYVDVDMWEKIILNLISNAFKYSREGAISVDIKQSGKQVLVSVSDTGVGVPEDQLDKIFNRFHRVEHTGGRSLEGTGIGLALVKELVKLHHGSIHVSSQLGKGSVFTVSIPVGKHHLPADKIFDASSAPAGYKHSAAFVEEALKWQINPTEQQSREAPAFTNDSGEPKQRVLLADDNADMRDYVQRLLTDQYYVITATDGEDAFEKALTYKPDLLLSDVMMPRLDGFGLLKKIRTHPETKNTPVIFLSARAGEEAKVEGLDAGADDYLVKPFSAKELIVRVSNHIRIDQIRRQTEKQFYQVFLQAPAIINVFQGPDHIFELYHPKNKEVFGNTDFTGKTIREALPSVQQDILEIMDDVYTNGITVRQHEVPLLHANGTGELAMRYFNSTFQPWFDVRGKIQGVLYFGVEVTDAVEARKKIEKSEREFRNVLLDSPSIFLLLKGRDMHITLANEPLFNSWGRGKEIIGKTLLEVLPELKDQPFPKLLEKVYMTGKAHFGREEKATIIKNGVLQDVYYDYVYQPVMENDNTVSGVTVMATDVTEQVMARKRIEESERKYRELTEKLELIVERRTLELQRSNEDLQQFAHVASHDLKEPVRKFKIFMSRLADEYSNLLPEKGKDYLNRMHNASERMSSMIEGVLKYSSLNESEQNIKAVDLNEIIRSIEMDLEVIIQQKKAVINKDELPRLEGATVLIYQLFYNLINNSLKFSDEKPVINISSSIVHPNGKDYARIIVNDNGIGFEPAEADKIFNAFTRLNSKDKYEGTGLGLALCKKIVERHHGTISATSEKNKGTTFTILLPLTQQKKGF